MLYRQNVLASDATFLLGVGAQKAGTSWLHDQLQLLSDANFGFLKKTTFSMLSSWSVLPASDPAPYTTEVAHLASGPVHRTS